MTEQEWLICNDARLMLVFLEDKSSPRKARFFACAIGRAMWPYLGDERSRRVVEVAERHADNTATEAELHLAESEALDSNRGWASRVARCAGDRWAWQGARVAMVCLQHALETREGRDVAKRVVSRSRQILACVFGNPFRTVALDSAWRTSDVLLLARGIYEEREFGGMPILADALQDAGCDSADILTHLRDASATHVRGCWALDLVLGKE